MHRTFVFPLLVALLAPATAQAFCGFYVSGADASLYNSATMVVMMREGTRTVLSMQNDYEGPPQAFAMVVPVPVVLQEDNVKTLPRAIFDRVDQLAAPRLVEYWETDPCAPPEPMRRFARRRAGSGATATARPAPAEDLGVTVEAEFSVGEYDIQILSANDSGGLDTWLRREEYNIPEGAEPILRPYVASGTKFFVAKVDPERVTFEDGKAVLSPLRFHYDAAEFSLPVRLGLLNSAGQQDLIVHILARRQRYEVANYPNSTIPTNIRVDDAVQQSFGSFYDLLYRRTVAQNPGSVVTEYAWDAGSCDPCPVPALNPGELATLGTDVIPGDPWGFVLTRLHYRYGRDGLDEDLVFRAASPIVGGRGMPDPEGRLGERDAAPSSMNNFQGRYVMLHPWEGPIACDSPRRGNWGGPPGQSTPDVFGARNVAMNPDTLSGGGDEAAGDAAPVTSLGLAVKVDVPPLGITAGTAEAPHPADPGPPAGAPQVAAVTPTPPATPPAPSPPPAPTPSTTTDGGGGCAGCSAGGDPLGGALLGAVVLGLLALRRRR